MFCKSKERKKKLRPRPESAQVTLAWSRPRCLREKPFSILFISQTGETHREAIRWSTKVQLAKVLRSNKSEFSWCQELNNSRHFQRPARSSLTELEEKFVVESRFHTREGRLYRPGAASTGRSGERLKNKFNQALFVGCLGQVNEGKRGNEQTRKT